MHKEEPLAFPMLFVRRGEVPSPTRYQYSPYVSAATTPHRHPPQRLHRVNREGISDLTPGLAQRGV